MGVSELWTRGAPLFPDGGTLDAGGAPVDLTGIIERAEEGGVPWATAGAS